MNMNEITVMYNGGSWKLTPENVQKINRYASILKDCPELLTFIQGFLYHDLKNTIETYLICFLSIWEINSLGLAMSFCIYSMITFMCYFFFDHFTALYGIAKEDAAFKIAFILFLSVYRIYAFSYWKKIFFAIFLAFFLFLSLPKTIFAILTPLVFSSILIQTETMYDSIRFL